MNPSIIIYMHPYHISYQVLQNAKRMLLSFYYDFLCKYLDQRMFEPILCDTNSWYIALGASTIEKCMKLEMLDEFMMHRYERIADPTSEWAQREPSLFKQEFKGDQIVALAFKLYCAEDSVIHKRKLAMKGVQSKGANNEGLMQYERFKWLRQSQMDESDTSRSTFMKAWNRGIKQYKGSVVTYS